MRPRRAGREGAGWSRVRLRAEAGAPEDRHAQPDSDAAAAPSSTARTRARRCSASPRQRRGWPAGRLRPTGAIGPGGAVAAPSRRRERPRRARRSISCIGSATVPRGARGPTAAARSSRCRQPGVGDVVAGSRRDHFRQAGEVTHALMRIGADGRSAGVYAASSPLERDAGARDPDAPRLGSSCAPSSREDREVERRHVARGRELRPAVGRGGANEKDEEAATQRRCGQPARGTLERGRASRISPAPRAKKVHADVQSHSTHLARLWHGALLDADGPRALQGDPACGHESFRRAADRPPAGRPSNASPSALPWLA